MKALVLESNGSLLFKNVPDPEPDKPDSILVRILAVGVCGSDVPRAFAHGAYHYPIILGHEFSGEVVESPKGSAFTRGAPVVVFPLLPCHHCLPCGTGDYAQCTDYDYFGSRRDGGFAELVWVPEENLFSIPDGTTYAHAAFAEPCAVALHGICKLPIAPGDSAVVYGAGPVGNLAAQWLRIRGCRDIMLVDVDTRKLLIAEEMGFLAVNPNVEDPVQRCFEQTDGQGADHGVEACGLPITFQQALQSTTRRGNVLFMGNLTGTFSLEEAVFSQILRKEIHIHGTWNSRIQPRGHDDWTTALKHIDSGVQVSRLISHEVNLEKGAEVLHNMATGNGFHNKVILLP